MPNYLLETQQLAPVIRQKLRPSLDMEFAGGQTAGLFFHSPREATAAARALAGLAIKKGELIIGGRPWRRGKARDDSPLFYLGPQPFHWPGRVTGLLNWLDRGTPKFDGSVAQKTLEQIGIQGSMRWNRLSLDLRTAGELLLAAAHHPRCLVLDQFAQRLHAASLGMTILGDLIHHFRRFEHAVIFCESMYSLNDLIQPDRTLIIAKRESIINESTASLLEKHRYFRARFDGPAPSQQIFSDPLFYYRYHQVICGLVKGAKPENLRDKLQQLQPQSLTFERPTLPLLVEAILNQEALK
jgi:hypothetical protein